MSLNKSIVRMARGADGGPALTLAGVTVSLFRDGSGVLAVDIETSDADGVDVLGFHGVPRLRVTVNEEDRWTCPDGRWRTEEDGEPETVLGLSPETLRDAAQAIRGEWPHDAKRRRALAAALENEAARAES